MTFDEWYHLNNDDSLCYQAARHAWNAAIEAAINKIETKNNKYYALRIEEVDFNNKTILACAEGAMTDLESELKKLLTAS